MSLSEFIKLLKKFHFIHASEDISDHRTPSLRSSLYCYIFKTLFVFWNKPANFIKVKISIKVSCFFFFQCSADEKLTTIFESQSKLETKIDPWRLQ